MYPRLPAPQVDKVESTSQKQELEACPDSATFRVEFQPYQREAIKALNSHLQLEKNKEKHKRRTITSCPHVERVHYAHGKCKYCYNFFGRMKFAVNC